MDVVALGLVKADAKKNYAPKAMTRPKLVPVTLRANPIGDQGFSNNTDTAGTFRINHGQIAGTGCSDIVLAFGNWATTFPGPNTLTIRASIEYGSQIFPVTFGGSRDATLIPGGTVFSDPLPLDFEHNKPYNNVFSRTYVSAATGQWPQGLAMQPGNGEGVSKGSPGSDLTGGSFYGSPTAVPFTSGAAFSPMAILGIQKDPRGTVCILGDSIDTGAGDTNNNGLGMVLRYLNGQYGYSILAKFGEKAQEFVASRFYRSRLLAHASTFTCGYGRNDITQGRTAAQVQADLLIIWQTAVMRGCKPGVQRTITPDTSASSNASPEATNAVRVAVNTWLRDGAPILNGAVAVTGSSAAGTLRAGSAGHPLRAVAEVADLVETARNSGIWTAGYTGDWIHPSATGAAAAAPAYAVLDLTV